MKACRNSADPRDQQVGEMGAGLLFSIQGSILTIQVRDHTKEADTLSDALLRWDDTGSAVQSVIEPPILKAPPIVREVSPDLHEDLVESFLKD